MDTSGSHHGKAVAALLLSGLAALGGAHRSAQAAYTLARTYALGVYDEYSITLTDSLRTDNPLTETLRESVTAVTQDGATVSAVTSNGTHSPKGRVTATTEFNSSASLTFKNSGIPTVPPFPSLNPLDALNLAMQGLMNNFTMGQTKAMPIMTSGGTSPATFTGQSTFVTFLPVPEFHVVGDVKSATGATLAHLDCILTIFKKASNVITADLTYTVGARTITAKFKRTGGA